MPDLFQGDQLVLCGRYSGDGSGDCVIKGDAGGEQQTFKVPVTFREDVGRAAVRAAPLGLAPRGLSAR